MAELLSTQPYKGSRDFYPDEMRSRKWAFAKIRETVESFGYEEIDAPLIEPIEIYLAKTSEEIVSQQIYSFTDRGNRKVAIRPEMTPTVSRMVAKKIREVSKPIRWYCLPNLWRYEQPGKGRLREHWQLNCDLFAAGNEFLADVEILQLAVQLLRNFNADQRHFQLRYNHRDILNVFFGEVLGLKAEQFAMVARILDKKAKLTAGEYQKMLAEQGLNQEQTKLIDDYLEQGLSFCIKHPQLNATTGVQYLQKLQQALSELNLTDYCVYDPSIVRGFDYYTGIVFEVYDLHPENNRSLFGGGRYDNLVANFVKDRTNAVGFGMGDVTLVEFLKTHGLHCELQRPSQIFIVNMAQPEDVKHQMQQYAIAQQLREHGFKVENSPLEAKLGKQLQEAQERQIDYAIIAGLDELARGEVTVKEIATREQHSVALSKLVEFFQLTACFTKK